MSEAELYRFFIEQAAKAITIKDMELEYLDDLDNIRRLAEAHHTYAEAMVELAK